MNFAWEYIPLIAMGAAKPPRDQEQRRLHIQVMIAGELARLRCGAMTARVTAQPEAIAQAFHVREMNLAPIIVLGL